MEGFGEEGVEAGGEGVVVGGQHRLLVAVEGVAHGCVEGDESVEE